MKKGPAKSCLSPLSVMRRLRALGAEIRAGRPLADADRAWFCECLDRYDEEAPLSGLSLERAFGLAPAAGKSSWWSEEELELRDENIRRVAHAYFGDIGIADQARKIEREARLIARGRPSRLPADAREMIQKALTGKRAFPAVGQMKNILRK